MSATAIAVEDLHKRFGAIEVLRGVSLGARQHEVVAIIGSSGSGKSTLLRCINMLETPDAGQVRIEGELIEMKPSGKGGQVARNQKQVQRLRTKLAMVFQQFNLWAHMTVLENIVEAPIHVLKVPRKEAREKAELLLHKVGLFEHKDYYPAYLSGGQQQRAAIARGLAVEPLAMLFDEPTSALDPELVGEVLKVIRDLAAEGRTMLVVTHEMGFAREVATQVVFLHQGLVEECGPPEQIFNQPRSEHLQRFLSGGQGR